MTFEHNQSDFSHFEICDLHCVFLTFMKYVLCVHRRIVGVAHVADFETIKDPSKRAECERQALELAKLVLKKRRNFNSISQVISAIREIQ